MTGTEFFLYLPQFGMTIDDIVQRARTAEEAGFTGISFMDHLAPPLAESRPMFEAMTLATWVASRTERLIVGHLVLCDGFRHPAVLARQAVALDHASGGRFELGIGWGSVASELVSNGISLDPPTQRIARLDESLEVIRALWAGGPVNHAGNHFDLTDAQMAPSPLDRIPIVIGGAGARTLDLVRRHADWWNLPAPSADRLDELAPMRGDARIATQHLVGMASGQAEVAEVDRRTRRPSAGWGRGSSSATPTPSSNTSAAWPLARSSAATCGSQTGPRRAPSPLRPPDHRRHERRSPPDAVA